MLTALYLLCLSSVALVAPNVALVHRQGSAFTTDVVLTVPRSAVTDAELDGALAAVLHSFGRLNSVFSEWHTGTPISRLNAAKGAWVEIPGEVHGVLQTALDVAALSHGAFDPTFKTYSPLWPLKSPRFKPPTAAQIAAVAPAVGYAQVVLEPHRVRLKDARTRIGLGGVAKGYAVELAVALLKKRGLSAFCLRVGGELYCAGEKAPGVPWVVGIQDPRDPSKLVASLRLRDAAFTTSGDYERQVIRGGVRYHHLLDVRTGQPARRSQSATVLARNPTEADALSTAFFVMGPKAALALVETMPAAELAIIGGDGRLHLSSGLRGTAQVEAAWKARLVSP